MRDRTRVGPTEGRRARQEASFYQEGGRRLARYFRARLVGRDETADLVQEALARFAGRTAEQMLGNPAAYLQRIARNLLVDRSRRRSAAPAMVGLEEQDAHPLLSVPPEQAHGIEAEDLMAEYERAVERLPPRTREVFVLHRVGDLSYAEIATRLRISVRTVEWHMGEALVRIRRALDGA